VDGLNLEATVARLADLAASCGGTVAGIDVERDDLLARNRGTTSAAARRLATETDVTAEPATQRGHWFPYARLTFAVPLDAIPDDARAE
jgi:hypothetical protein